MSNDEVNGSEHLGHYASADEVKITEVPNDQVRLPDMTPTQAAFRMLSMWARERMPDGNQRMPDGMLCAACMHMAAMLTAVYSNEPNMEDPLQELLGDIDKMYWDYKQTDALRRANPTGAPQ